MASIIQIRRDTASDWTSANPTLAQGELALETDTLKLKAGDGTTAWTSLAYYTLGTAGFLATSTIGSTVQAFDADTSKLDVAETRSASSNFADNVLQRPVLKDYGEVKVAMSAHAVDLELGNVFTYTLSGGQTVTFTNPPASGTAGSFTMIVTNGGSATLTWPSSVDWPAGTAPALTASGVDLIFFTTIDGGTIWYGTAVLAMG
jgi:hypothetical protein